VGSTAVVEQTVDFGERRRSYLDARAGRERGRECSAEGANEQGEVGERGAGSKGARGAEVVGDCADVGASTAGAGAGG
jgi:hypothetical protein